MCLALFAVDHAFYLFVLAVVYTFLVIIYHGNREIDFDQALVLQAVEIDIKTRAWTVTRVKLE